MVQADAEVYDPVTRASTIGMTVSGLVEYDAVGRVVAEHQPSFSAGTDYLYTGPAPARRPTTSRYDILGRVTAQTLPDTSTITTRYGIENGRDVTITTDPEGRIVRQSTDVRGNIESVTDYPAGIPTTTSYTYNVLGELLAVTDPQGNVIQSEYDTLGRRTALVTPNSGRVESTFDLAGNLVTRVDANLRAKGQAIHYRYRYNRLEAIDYPTSTDVVYTYGAPGSGHGAGRTSEVTDQAGTTQYTYGAMGETTGITRTLARLTPGKERDPRSYTLGYRYDYQGRMETITYPDGERLTYHYDAGGQVNRVTGTWNGTEYVYVEAIGYDEFGQRNHIRYGNGVETTYQYDPNRRWLANIWTGTGFETFQSIDYQFDRVGNILSTINTGTTRSSSQSYSYDDRYQLVSASGTTTTTLGGLTLEENHYTQRYRYDVIGNMTAKTSTNRIMPSVETPAHLNYDLTYTYDPARPHQATRIGELSYRYDSNGNLTQVYDPTTTDPATPTAPPPREDLGPYRGSAPEAFGRYRWNESAEPEDVIAGYRWNEDNRLTQSTTGDNVVTDYRYDAQGTRRVKYSRVYGETLYADRMYQEHVGTTPTAAVTKHIFVGQTRIASKLHYTDQSPGTRALYMTQNTFWYHPDHLGSTNWVTDAQGEGYEHFTYTPYGEAWVEEHLSSRIHRMSHRFTGQELDPETGLYAFPARNYDPRTSRWLSADPAGLELMNPNGENGGLRHGFSVIESTNWYNYVSNNPLRYVDPLGLSGGDVVEKSPPLTQVEGLHPAAQALVDKINEVLGREEVQPGFPTDDELAAGALPERGQSPSRATWCNRAACAIADESGANTDSLLNPHRDTGDPSVAWTDANDMYANAVAASNDPTSGVLEVTPEQADALAREGTTVMAIAPGLVDANGNQGRGHAGVVYPSTGPYNPETGPMIGQAGASVGIRSAAESFGRLQPKYFALPGR